ncbi:MAG TPA: hypothetical protein DEA26_10400 [Oceanospirillales bacterium]|nr:hypothetical protein [Oceanospirillaceae bacterium]MAR01569.1 hypothetical protein [Oceanospirillaceae bacterium]HBS43081.1 hypothetical protein [Oceanospirillales bacterium]|tara:strand:+ start:54095 stop:55360 length:1266 start_codon:yes stop_codon:yes gene_type:complete
MIRRPEKRLFTRKPLGLLLATLLVPAVLSGKAYAAADSVSTKTYNRLTEAQEFITNSQFAEAKVILDELVTSVNDNSIDKALTYQLIGYTEMSQNNYPKAISAFMETLSYEKLPEQLRINIGYMVAQLYAAEGEYDKALDFAREWFVTLEAPTADQYIFMANIFAQTKNYSEAVPYAVKAIDMSDDPKETWFQVLIASYFELKQYQNSEKYLKMAITNWPTKQAYWEQLASVYLMQDKMEPALVTLQLAWKGEWIEKEGLIQNLIQLAVNEGIPEHAARLLVQAMDRGVIPENAKYVDSLANAWLAAKEFDKAIASFERLSDINGEAKPLEKVANIHLQQAQWKEAEKAARAALEKTSDKPGNIWFALGMALAEQERFDEGISALRKAKAYDYSSRKAGQWIKYAEGLKRQKQWVEQNRNS